MKFLFFFVILIDQWNRCKGVENSCVYNSSNGIIDLTQLGRKDGIPKWKNQIPDLQEKHVYSYNPCYSFSQGNCKDVASCQQYGTEESLTYSLGSQESIEWESHGNDLPYIYYTSTDGRKLLVTLKCLSDGESDQLLVHGYEDAVKLYVMVLSSKCACWNGCKGGGGGDQPDDGSKGGLTFGGIFFIILVVLIFVYLFTMISFNKLQRKATGVDIIPHRTFWVSIPGLAREGVRFTYNKLTRKTEYTSIK